VQFEITVPTLEDKIVQRAVVAVLNAVYETDFLGFSYGFRPGRSPHWALDALTVGIMTKKVNWVLDADIRSFFDTLKHEWLVRFIEHRVADRRVVRLIQKWLNAGVLDEGHRITSEIGTVQGGSINLVRSSPISICTTSSTSGPIDGGSGRRTATWWSSGLPTISSWASSIETTPSSF
jgi:RNA-directed DNA polymerase